MVRRKPQDPSFRNERGQKQCPVCIKWLDPRAFAKHPSRKDGLQHRCRTCAAEGYRDQWRDQKYGLQPGGIDAIIMRQDGRCAVCQTSLEGMGLQYNSPHVDHDHSCCPGVRSCGKCVRGVLCKGCNVMLGAAKDNAEVLRAAVRYLEGV